MDEKVYKNINRVVLADKIVINTFWQERLGMSKMAISRWCINLHKQRSIAN